MPIVATAVTSLPVRYAMSAVRAPEKRRRDVRRLDADHVARRASW